MRALGAPARGGEVLPLGLDRLAGGHAEAAAHPQPLLLRVGVLRRDEVGVERVLVEHLRRRGLDLVDRVRQSGREDRVVVVLDQLHVVQVPDVVARRAARADVLARPRVGTHARGEAA